MLKRQERETLMKASGKIEAIASLIGNENASAELLNVSEMINAMLERDDLSVVTCSLTKSVSLD
jgi:CO dehydrogenase/acetyl-CoA synthase alpha subunit